MRRNDAGAEGPTTRNSAPVDFGLFAPEQPIAGARVAPLKFAQDGPLKSMVRRNDHATSKAAALAIEPRLSELQAQVLAALRHHGPMTDLELENLPEFKHYAPSTVRHRRTDLFNMEPKEVIPLNERRPNATGSATLRVWKSVR